MGSPYGVICGSLRSLNLPAFLARSLLILALISGASGARAQNADGTPTDLNEGKNAAQLFAADCQVCHAKPQGLAKGGLGLTTLSGFLRQHYTSSTQAASALAAYLTSAGPGSGPPAAATTPGRRGMPNAEPAAVPRRGEPGEGPSRRASAPANEPEGTIRPPRRIPGTPAKPDGKPEPGGARRPAPAAASVDAPKPAAVVPEPAVEARPEPPKPEPKPEAKPAPKPKLEEIFD
jgi:hypothetical protein